MSIQSEKVKKWRKESKSKILLAMGCKCQICGYDKCPEALDLHHLDPTVKEFGISQIRTSPKSFSTIINELSKCILLCVRCHREVHANISTIPLIYSKLDTSYIIKPKIIKVKNKKPRPRKFDPSIEELTELVKNNSLVKVGKIFNVSDNAVRKRCIKLNIDF